MLPDIKEMALRKKQSHQRQSHNADVCPSGRVSCCGTLKMVRDVAGLQTQKCGMRAARWSIQVGNATIADLSIKVIHGDKCLHHDTASQLLKMFIPVHPSFRNSYQHYTNRMADTYSKDGKTSCSSHLNVRSSAFPISLMDSNWGFYRAFILPGRKSFYKSSNTTKKTQSITMIFFYQ